MSGRRRAGRAASGRRGGAAGCWLAISRRAFFSGEAAFFSGDLERSLAAAAGEALAGEALELMAGGLARLLACWLVGVPGWRLEGWAGVE